MSKRGSTVAIATKEPIPAAKPGRPREVTDEALVMWVQLIAEGNRERAAADIVEAKHGVCRNSLRSYADRHPEWQKRLDQAHEAVRNKLQKVVFDEATTPNLTEEPASVKNRVTAAVTMLRQVDHEVWSERKNVKSELTLKPAPSDDSPERVAEEALGLLTEEQLAAVLARRKGE